MTDREAEQKFVEQWGVSPCVARLYATTCLGKLWKKRGDDLARRSIHYFVGMARAGDEFYASRPYLVVEAQTALD